MRPIDADALEKTLRDWISDHWTEAFTGDDAGSEFADMIEHAATIVHYEDMVHAIKHLPSAQPEIIRCKDCRHNNWCDMQEAAMAGDNFFCGAAERTNK